MTVRRAKCWAPDDPDTYTGICDDCGEDGPVQDHHAPHEVEGLSKEDTGPHPYCLPCYQRRCDDI